MGWWRFTRLALEALTSPIDVAECDRAMEQLARESRLGAALHRVSWSVRAAWAGSRTRRAAVVIAAPLAPIRLRGWAIVVAGATAFVLDRLKPRPVGPMSALMPSLVIAAGVLIMLAAGPLARAIAGRAASRTPAPRG